MDMIANIHKELARKNHVPFANTSFKPAQKYAFYNPARKNKDGNVVIRPGLIFPIMACMFCIYIAWNMIITKSFIFLTIPITLVIGIVTFTFSFYLRKFSITINHDGINFRGTEYHWENYTDAYIFITGNRGAWYLVLIEAKGNFTPLRLLPFDEIEIICTAIRDFQPKVSNESLPAKQQD
ncbi:hypothetical protein [Chitinophaga sp.]|uniref:hypothetical protein n=1 Tax=Chitinophaga sp. TaxID=1869181 RepID=UPI0031DADF6E